MVPLVPPAFANVAKIGDVTDKVEQTTDVSKQKPIEGRVVVAVRASDRAIAAAEIIRDRMGAVIAVDRTIGGLRWPERGVVVVARAGVGIVLLRRRQRCK